MFGPWLVMAGCSSPGNVEPDDFDPEVVVAPPGVPERIVSVPVYGGTLEPVPALGGLVAADPQGDRLLRIVGNDSVTIGLGPNARPFRVYVEGTDVWVTLRGTGELARVDLAAAKLTWHVPVCTEPRGVTRSQAGPLIVACADGPLVEVSDDGEVLRAVLVAPDLRDVVPVDDVLYVSRFASAEVILVDPLTLETSFKTPVRFDGRVAWRMRPNGKAGVYVLHQSVDEGVLFLDDDEDLDTGTPGSGGGGSYAPGGVDPGRCDHLHPSTFTELDHTGSRDEPQPSAVGTGSLSEIGVTDFAFSADGQLVVAVTGARETAPSVVTYPGIDSLFGSPSSCGLGTPVEAAPLGPSSAVAFDVDGTVVVQSSGPTEILRVDGDTVFPIVSGTLTAEDQPLRDFHRAAPADVSCASCHPEGGDDGTVWNFFLVDGDGVRDVRRTMPLAGALLSRTPYHWDASQADPEALMLDTFTQRMGGETMLPEDTAALFAWLDGLRPVSANAARTADVVERGREAFAIAGCAECHAGSAFTDGLVHAVRIVTDEHVKTPSLLGVGSRSPLFHDGCAVTLEARFTSPCDEGTDLHGRLSGMPPADIDALTAYLRTL